jgi:hypothetical protein
MVSGSGIGQSWWRGVLAGLVAAGLGSALALAASASGDPSGGAKFGVYTALEQHGDEQLQVILSVEDPTTKLSLTAQCAKLGATKNVVEVWNSPVIALRGNGFSFHRQVKISKVTETKTMAVLSHSTYVAVVQVSGRFAHERATGNAKIGGSTCSQTGYTAKPKPGPTLT